MAKTFFDDFDESDDVLENDNLSFDFSIIDGYDDDNEELKFDLYLMTRQIRQVTSSLQQIVLLPKNKRQKWVEQNHTRLNQLMEGLVSDVMSMFEEMQADKMVLDDTISCVSELRELITMLNSLTGEEHRLRS